MKIKDLKFETDHKIDRFLRRCFLSVLCYEEDGIYYEFHKETADRARRLLRASQTVDEFVDAFIADEAFAGTQAYAEVIKRERPSKRWMAIRKMFGDKQFKTLSDAGCVKIGNESFQAMVRNGRGDGVTRVAIFGADDDFNSDLFDGIDVTLNGSFDIYQYDCGNEVAKSVSGRFFVYSYDGFVALKEFRYE